MHSQWFVQCYADYSTVLLFAMQYAVSNWPAGFDITAPYKTADAESTTVSVAESSSAPSSSVPKSHEWASELIASSGSTEFQFPAGFQHNARDNRDRRERKEHALRVQWDAAVVESRNGTPRDRVVAEQDGDSVQTEAVGEPWSWLCGQCVQDLGPALIGADVTVWWHDDKQCYRGAIDAYDAASQCHRVLYEDNEWEFVNLAIEPAAFGSANEFVLPQQASAGNKRKK
jgi:hypothetical protein